VHPRRPLDQPRRQIRSWDSPFLLAGLQEAAMKLSRLVPGSKLRTMIDAEDDNRIALNTIDDDTAVPARPFHAFQEVLHGDPFEEPLPRGLRSPISQAELFPGLGHFMLASKFSAIRLFQRPFQVLNLFFGQLISRLVGRQRQE
jgi:hypothetical protein